jgi:isoquinoline 1-oxidoreductase alpha subunit
MPQIQLNVNDEARTIDAVQEMPLLWAIRDLLSLTGTKYGCGAGECGSCTIHIDGQAVRSCITPLSAAIGKKVTTIEGLGTDAALHPVQQAWIDNDVPQCGYCQVGQVMTAAALLAEKPEPSDADIDATMSDLVCRCGTYKRIRAAIHAAAAGGLR